MAKTRVPPDQEELWAQLCEEADAFVLAYWTRFMDEGWLAESNSQRWVEEAEAHLWRKGGGSRTQRPSLIMTWWTARVGERQARKALQLWQQEVRDI